MAFFYYRQNNSGGHFIVNDDVAHYVIIEADTWRQANAKAEDIGLYFDGDGDCPTCGTRWDSAEYTKGSDVPSIYGAPLLEFKHSFPSYMEEKIYVYFKDNRKDTYVGAKNGKGFRKTK